MELIAIWFNTYTRDHVNSLDGRTRFKLQSFFDEYVLLGHGNNVNFTLRENIGTLIHEATLMVKLTWRLITNSIITSHLSNELYEIITYIRNLSVTSKNHVTPSLVHEVISKLAIQRFFHYIFIEQLDNAYSLLIGSHIITIRLFKLKKNTDTSMPSTLCMRSCAEYGSIIGTQMHIYRTGSASLIACTQANCWDTILQEIDDSRLCHVISPLIKRVKHMHSQKIDVRHKQLKENGDIIIDNYYFQKCQWSMLVPKIISKFDTILSEVFVDLYWKDIVNVSNNIHVSQKLDRQLYTVNELLHYDAFINVNGKITNLSDCQIHLANKDNEIDMLCGLVMICLHGLGLGATRIAEICRLQQHQIYWKNDSFYYITCSHKRPSCKSDSRKIVTHKLPPEISRYLLLYDYIGMSYYPGRDEFLFPRCIIDSTAETTYGNNQHFYGIFSSFFEFEMNCNGLVMRHLYTSICNYIFPSDKNIQNASATTVGIIAEMSGHSIETHDLYYSSCIDKEGFFDKYHSSLGATISNNANLFAPFKIASDSDILNCLKVLYGTNATFFNNLQQQMVTDSINNCLSHTFCGIGCGGGKSLCWLLPTIDRIMKNTSPKMVLVVIPYCFLVQHHYHKSLQVTSITKSFGVEMLTGAMVSESVLPNVFRDLASLPSILYLSLEAFVKVVKYHFAFIEIMISKSLIHKVFIDECHTVLSELHFREKYYEIGKISAIGLPIMACSGSYPRGLIDDFTHFVFGSPRYIKYNCLIDESLFGTKLPKLEVSISDDYLKETCKFVRAFLKQFSNYHVHVIVSTKDEGRFIYLVLLL